MYIVTIDKDEPDYLQHFGVLGMHWGVRNAETQRKYDSGQKHSAPRTDIANPTEGHSYQGKTSPHLSKKQKDMLKRTAAGVALGTGLAAGVIIGSRSNVVRTVAKHGAKKLASSAHLQKKGKEFADRVRSEGVKTAKTLRFQKNRTAAKQAALRKVVKAQRQASKYGGKARQKLAPVTVKADILARKTRRDAANLRKKVWSNKRFAAVRKANDRANYYLRDAQGKKKAANRLTAAGVVGAVASAPLIESRSVNSGELRRKNGRHASTKWMRNKERMQ